MARKLRADAPRIITANRLIDGVVVYRAADGSWTTRLNKARVVTNAPDLDAMMPGCMADVEACQVVSLDVVEVLHDPKAGPRPLGQRETIRAAGPTIVLPVDRPIPAARPSA
ncbi:DUF2849 domain-containing protein [Roseospira marina]|uniref:DUF2849 domain-containing protein n=1 Tax=Roseospira marina TaxID=140057 RepID=A0A5M6IGG5_9PROT|nr:DUF2849 domain-containing protein [Roseospira marina]KAA5607363.1 DUF2849 domain-containing protein [Roseospira marina]MBB4312469.1 hypothetical protein [Roseospira marina]MBB5085515.1 hypothetical protein [Roseospira marina]